MKRITRAGIYSIPAEDYHADPVKGGSMTSTTARRLVQAPPARVRYELAHPPQSSDAQIIGQAVHTLVLHVGPTPERIDAPDWRTKAARQARDEALKFGKVPLLAHQYDRAYAMADAVCKHPVAGRLVDPARGRPEQTMVWQDPETEVWCRAMVDHLPHQRDDQRPILVDLKTTVAGDSKALAKTIAQHGYHQQAAWYLAGYRALHPGSDPAFLFVFVEKDPPHLVRVVELDEQALDLGAELNRRALWTYAECTATGRWPGHSPEIELVSLPPWAWSRLEEAV
ncbi:MAG TPA: PD-(D/E)XK nuclease-like domain-containing protein [Micromonosporaceae bacterium]